MKFFLAKFELENDDGAYEECITVRNIEDDIDMVLFDIANNGLSVWWDFVFGRQIDIKVIGIDEL